MKYGSMEFRKELTLRPTGAMSRIVGLKAAAMEVRLHPEGRTGTNSLGLTPQTKTSLWYCLANGERSWKENDISLSRDMKY